MFSTKINSTIPQNGGGGGGGGVIWKNEDLPNKTSLISVLLKLKAVYIYSDYFKFRSLISEPEGLTRITTLST